ncbi:yihS [Symbiodinium sp. CCMP2592]|nr:yihS [Symbiodinium sp. CCMP2592]
MAERLPTSSTYGAEEVLEVREAEPTTSAYRRAEADATQRSSYDKAVLRTLYYHNWYTGRSAECPTAISSCSRFFLSHAFWVGIAGFGDAERPRLRETALEVALTPSEVLAFDAAAATQNALYTYGTMPQEVVQKLASNWTTECDIKGKLIIGVSVLSNADHPVPCPSDLRYQEVERVVPRLMPGSAYTQSWFFVFYYDLRPFVQAEAAFSIATTVFICVILCIASIMFTSTANALVLAPVEKMMRKVEAIRSNPLAATKLADDEFQREAQRRVAEGEKGAGKEEEGRAEQLALEALRLDRHWCPQRYPTKVFNGIIHETPKLLALPRRSCVAASCQEFLTQHIRGIIGFYQPRLSSLVLLSLPCCASRCRRAVDPSGGFFQSFYIDGRKFNPEFRQIVSSSRMVINFMLAGKLLQDPKLLDIGRHGLEYIEKVHYNPAKQSYAFTVRNHKPEDMVEQAYGYAFILAAHAAARAAGVAKDNVEVGRVFDLLERKFWLPDKGAYLDTISAEGVVDNSYRGQNSNMHMCEALIAAYEATKETRYLDRAEVLAETFAATPVPSLDQPNYGGGFVWEHYDVNFEIDWEYNKNDPTNIYRPWGFQPGHQIEWAKNLLNIYRHRPKFWMVNRAKELFDGSWDLSWDDCHGGLVYGFGPDRKWCDSEKYFWVQGESIATASLLYQATKDPKYIEKYVCLWQYCWKHWVDHEHGGWLCFKMSRSNERTNDEKAIAGGKCDYHTLVSCHLASHGSGQAKVGVVQRTEAQEPMETVILEKTIIKLGSLLALGFGEAGANIVSSNMDGANSGVNAMVEGSMVNCIVGVVRILNFSTATEVLQGKVMTFVNQIAEIVHGVVDECWGAVNKNDGDNFLVIWRLGDLTANEVHLRPPAPA